MNGTKFALLAIVAGTWIGLSTAAPIPGGPTDKQLEERAIKLNELTDKDAMQKKLTELIDDKDTTKRLVKLAADMQKADPKDPPFKFNAAIILAKAAHNVKDFDSAELFYEFAGDQASKLQSAPRMLQAYEGLIDLYWEQKKYRSVEEVCQKLMETRGGGNEVENAKVLVLERMVQAKAKQGDIDEAMRMVDSLIQLDKDGWYFLQLKGWVQREAGKFDDAIETYKEVITKLDDSKLDKEVRERIQKNLSYMMTGLFVDNNQVDKAAAQLEKLIEKDPENPTYYNDLGYILADNDMRMEEAEKFVRKALELDGKQREKLLEEGKISAEVAKQENAAYLDSLGWVLYKQEKYEEALKYLKKATEDEDEGNHLEIWDHLADTYVKLGNYEKAVETWKKALTFDDISKRDVDRRKKVTEKLRDAQAKLEESK